MTTYHFTPDYDSELVKATGKLIANMNSREVNTIYELLEVRFAMLDAEASKELALTPGERVTFTFKKGKRTIRRETGIVRVPGPVTSVLTSSGAVWKVNARMIERV